MYMRHNIYIYIYILANADAQQERESHCSHTHACMHIRTISHASFFFFVLPLTFKILLSPNPVIHLLMKKEGEDEQDVKGK